MADNQYKSNGERAIAEVLTKYKVEFVYEYPILIKQQEEDDNEKLRIWYPDFWLPKYSIIIEFFGREGDPNYDQGKQKKLKAYRRLDIDCISVKPCTIQKNLQAYLLMSISRLINEKKRHFENRNKPSNNT